MNPKHQNLNSWVRVAGHGFEALSRHGAGGARVKGLEEPLNHRFPPVEGAFLGYIGIQKGIQGYLGVSPPRI